MKSREDSRADIEFEGPKGAAREPAVRLSGIPAELARSPEKIRQLMDLLELPEGTNARVTVMTASVIVR